MTVPARLQSVLRALTEGDPSPQVRKHPCFLLHACDCGKPLLYSLLVPQAPNFGHHKGIDRSWTWTTITPIEREGVLPLFKRAKLAMSKHLEFQCPVCRRRTHVQVASDGGLLPLGTMQLVYIPLPPKKKEILYVEEAS